MKEDPNESRGKLVLRVDAITVDPPKAVSGQPSILEEWEEDPQF